MNMAKIRRRKGALARLRSQLASGSKTARLTLVDREEDVTMSLDESDRERIAAEIETLEGRIY